MANRPPPERPCTGWPATWRLAGPRYLSTAVIRLWWIVGSLPPSQPTVTTGAPTGDTWSVPPTRTAPIGASVKMLTSARSRFRSHEITWPAMPRGPWGPKRSTSIRPLPSESRKTWPQVRIKASPWRLSITVPVAQETPVVSSTRRRAVALRSRCSSSARLPAPAWASARGGARGGVWLPRVLASPRGVVPSGDTEGSTTRGAAAATGAGTTAGSVSRCVCEAARGTGTPGIGVGSAAGWAAEPARGDAAPRGAAAFAISCSSSSRVVAPLMRPTSCPFTSST